MQATIKQISQFSFCPKYMEQGGDVPFSTPDLHREYSALFMLAFRKVFESEGLVSWKFVQDKWAKLFWEVHSKSAETERKFNQTLIAIMAFWKWLCHSFQTNKYKVLAMNYALKFPIYSHELIAEVPVVLTHTGEDFKDPLTIVLFEPNMEHSLFHINSVARYTLAGFDESDICVDRVINLSVSPPASFHAISLEPDERLLQASLNDMVSIFESMQRGFSYPNTMACGVCPLRLSCEAVT